MVPRAAKVQYGLTIRLAWQTRAPPDGISRNAPRCGSRIVQLLSDWHPEVRQYVCIVKQYRGRKQAVDSEQEKRWHDQLSPRQPLLTTATNANDATWKSAGGVTGA
jgi:hypothetical protein